MTLSHLLYSGAHSYAIQPGQGLMSLQGATDHKFAGIQHKEGKVTDTKKILYAIYQDSPP